MSLSAAKLFTRHFSIFLLAALLFQTAHTQSDYRIEKYNALNGLAKDHWVRDINSDQEGMIWLVLNQGGLARFDGEVFTLYPIPSELRGDGEIQLQKLEIDRNGKFWVLAYQQVYYFDPATGMYTLPSEVEGIPNSLVYDVLYTLDGEIVLNVKNKLYQVLSEAQGKAKFIGDIEGYTPLFEVKKAEQGGLWVATSTGFLHYPPGKPVPEKFGYQHTAGNPLPPFPLTNVKSLDALPAPNGLWFYDGSALYKLNPQGRELERYKMKEFDYLYAVHETGDIKWFGTFDGLIKVSHRSKRFHTWLEEPFDLADGAVTGNSCYGLAESASGSIFTTSEISVYEIYPSEPGKTRHITSTVHTRRYGKMTDQQGRIWFSLNGSLADVFTPETGQLQRVALDTSLNFSNSFLQTKDGKIWVGCVKGIGMIDPNTLQASKFPLPEKDFVWHLYQSADGVIWAATKNGLLKILPQKGENVTRFNAANTPGMTATEILSIHEAEGFLWLGSTAGLVRFDPKTGGAATFTTARDGLPNDVVYAAIPAEGFLWLPTNKGLARVSLKSAMQTKAELLDLYTFGTDDGLPHHEFNTLTFLKAKNGKIWVGGLNGIASFDPKELLPQPSENKAVVIAEFTKYDQRADSLLNFSVFKNKPDEPFILRPQEQFFTARFALLDYRNPKANQYSYKLEGFDPDWIFAGNQSTLRYANLPPGTYNLRIRAANPNGAWSKQEATATIIVQQVWYKTGWAWAAYLLFAAGLGYLGWKLRLRQLRLAHRLEMEQTRSRDLQELEEFKSRFFTNITHEFRTPLTVILGMAEKLESDGVTLSHPVTHAVSLIKRNGQNLLRLINQILDLAKLEGNSLKINYMQGDVLPYLRYIAESLHSLANAQNVMLRVESPEAEIVMDYDPERLLQIVHNLLSNAIKFTPSGGKVLLRADLQNLKDFASLVLTVSDTGAGIPLEDLPKIFDRFYQAENQEHAKAGGTGIGLSLTKELVKAMGGEISVESEVGTGTTFSVRLPVTNAAPVAGTDLSESLNLSERLAPPTGTDQLSERLANYSAIEPSNHLLLIEDNPDVVEYLAACLGENYQLDYATMAVRA